MANNDDGVPHDHANTRDFVVTRGARGGHRALRWTARSIVVSVVIVATTLCSISGADARPSMIDQDVRGGTSVGDPSPSTIKPLIVTRLDRRITAPALGRDVSVAVVDLATGAIAYTHRPNARQLPASTMKLVTASNALATMGARHRLSTIVFVDHRRNMVTLQCGGDPLLTSDNLRRLARAAARRVDRSKPVRVVIDSRLFPRPSRAPGWPGAYLPLVVAPVTCLGRLGDYSTDPIAGSAAVFTRTLGAQGVRVASTRFLHRGRAQQPPGVVVGTVSHSVRQAVQHMLQVSENNVAEVLYRHIALARGLPPTWRGGRRAAVATQRELGMDGTGTRLADGSGVSRADRLTATGLARLVYLTRTDPRFTTMYAPAAMPRAGRTGTLASRYHRFSAPQTTCARGRVLAKTGTLHDTVSLAGVARGKRGTPADGHAYAFAVLVNNRVSSTSTLTVRKNVDRIATTLTGCW